MALAQLYAGVVYVSLGREDLAQARFEAALTADPRSSLNPDEFPRRATRVFEAARTAHASKMALERESRKGRGKGPILLLGAGAAAAVGIAVAIAPSERPNEPPTAAIQVGLAGDPIVSVTSVPFTAIATDPEGEPLSYSWSFGDGGSATGPSVTHVFPQEGSLEVVLTVRDGLTSTQATARVTVGSLTGMWQVSPPLFSGETTMELIQQGTLLRSPLMNCGPAGRGYSDGGQIFPPRSVEMVFSAVGSVACGACEYQFVGEVDESLRAISGSLSCSAYIRPLWPGGCPCDGEQVGATFAR